MAAHTINFPADSQYKVEALNRNWNAPSTLRFSIPTRADTGTILNNDTIIFQVEDTERFRGKVKEHGNQISDQENISYMVTDPWEWLAANPCQVNNSALVIYNDEYDIAYADRKTLGEILIDILANGDIPTSVIETYDSAILATGSWFSVKPFSLYFDSVSYDTAIRTLLSLAGHYGARIYWTGTEWHLGIEDLSGLTPKDAYLGELGTAITTHNITDMGLDYSLNGCITKMIIEGSKKIVQLGADTMETLTGDWDAGLETMWTPKKARDNPTTYGKVFKHFASAHADWHKSLVDEDGDFTQDVPSFFVYKGAVLRYNTGFYKINYKAGKVILQQPRFYYDNVTKQNKALIIKAIYAYRSEPFRVEKQSAGTAHALGYESKLVFRCEDMKHITINGILERDDTADMEALAEAYYSFRQNERINGFVEISGLNFDWSLGKCVNIKNAAAGKWDSSEIPVISMGYDFAAYKTKLDLTTNTFLEGLISIRDIWEEMQARKRENRLEEESKLYMSMVLSSQKDQDEASASEAGKLIKIISETLSPYKVKECDKDGSVVGDEFDAWEIDSALDVPIDSIHQASYDADDKCTFKMWTTGLVKVQTNVGAGVYTVKFCDKDGVVTGAVFNAYDVRARANTPLARVLEANFNPEDAKWMIGDLGFVRYVP